MITKVYDTGMEDRSEIVTDENVTSHAPMISMIDSHMPCYWGLYCGSSIDD